MAPPQWAYQLENFVNEPDEELVCSICRAVFCDPVMCPCDHVFCRACISKWLQSNRNCPICRKRASSTSIKQTVPIIKNLIMKLTLNCHNKGLGCKSQFSVENSETHVKECEYEFVQCKNKPCKDKLFRKDVTDHETNDCPHRCIKCKKCKSKMPTTVPPEKHDCIQALQLRIREKTELLKKKNLRIRQLKTENKSLKATSEDSAARLSSATSSRRRRESSASPERIMINIQEFDSSSTSFSSDSDSSSEDNFIIFANGPSDHSDDNAGSESFSGYMEDNEDSVEYSRNESLPEMGEYRNAESQTLDDLPSNEQPQESARDRNATSFFGNENPAVEAPNSANEETGERSRQRRPVKRRPTTQKPAKRRYPQVLVSSEDDDVESEQHSSPQLSRQCWTVSSTEADEAMIGNDGGENSNSSTVAGPSSAAAGSNDVESDETSNTDWHFWSRCKLGQRRGRAASSRTSENAADAGNSRPSVPSRNAVFERTLALLEQYNLESDPEWLPEYASHRGNDTTDSDSSSSPRLHFRIASSSSSSDDVTSDVNNDNLDSSGMQCFPTEMKEI